METKDLHKEITEELYMEGVRYLLLEYTLDVFNGSDFPKDRDIDKVKEYIHKWVDARFPVSVYEVLNEEG